MESILARALEYTLKYWLKSFSRDQFKLQGRTLHLSNLDIDGDVLHSSLGLPPALNVATAKVGKLEIMLPSVSNVQVEPIIVQIDRLDLVLEENDDFDAAASSNSTTPSAASQKGSGYGFADKIADGMTIQIHTVNLLLETRGGARRKGGATWTPPMASITIRNLSLYTTNESWQVVNLKEAREFSSNKKYIYVFKKLEWESLSIDLLPHPDMFIDTTLGRSQEGSNLRDDDGAKRVFFGGERFLEGISGEAYITLQRTDLNSPLGLEVQLHINEAVCPALSEPGLRALLRFMTGLYVCLNRGDVDLKAQQRSTEAAGRSLVSIVVDHIFLCIKDTEFQLELLMQSLFFSRASISEGDSDNNLTRITIGGLFLRDTFSSPPCTLVQPSMQVVTKDAFHVPEFARSFCPPIYPLGEQQWQLVEGTPLISLHALQIMPSPLPPSFASQTVINCQPLMIHLQEETCLRISSFLADGIAVNPGDILPDFSIKSFTFTLKELDLTVPLDKVEFDMSKSEMDNNTIQTSFTGARLHMESLFFLDSPSLKLRMLNLEKDPACFSLWEGQPIDASQKKWTARASQLTLSLEACNGTTGRLRQTIGLWRCVDLKDACIEVAMATADGSPLLKIPPPGGIVRVGVACEQHLSNTSVEQLFFVLSLYGYFGAVSEKIAMAGKRKQLEDIRERSFSGKLMDKVPSDTAVSLTVRDLQLRFLESSSVNVEGMPLVKFIGDDLFISATHRTLGGAIVVSSTLRWEGVQIDCVEAEGHLPCENGSFLSPGENIPLPSDNGYPQLRAVFWVHKNKKHPINGNAHSAPFLDISMVHVIPLHEQDMESHSLNVSASVSGVRLGGGMNYTEALLHRFGILGPDGGPGTGLCKGLENLQKGPLSKLFKTTPLVDNSEDVESMSNGNNTSFPHLKKPDDVDVTIELRDWLFALEGAQQTAERWWFSSLDGVDREERCWHTAFRGLRVNAKTRPTNVLDGKALRRKKQNSVELVTVGVEGLRILKPHTPKHTPSSMLITDGDKEYGNTTDGIGLEVRLILFEDNVDNEMVNWEVEDLKFSVKQPIEAAVTKDELQHLTFLCKSEIDSAGRITAGILRLLKLEGSVGQSVIEQLGNLGSEGIDKIFSSEKVGREGSAGSRGLSPLPNLTNEGSQKTMEQTLSLLEETILDSQAKLNELITYVDTSESSSSQHLTIMKLSQKIDTMQGLLMQLRNQL